MTVDVAALKERVDIVQVVGSYVDLKRRGHEYVGLCVNHNDSTPSMWVIPNKRFVHCFACDFSADVIEFVQHMDGCDFKAACDKLGNGHDWTPKAPIRHEATKPKPERVTCKPPADAGEPDMTLRGIGAPSRVWPYRDLDGSVLGYVARYDTQGGKEIRCWTWGRRGDDEPAWGCGHWTKPRPLYGLQALNKREGSPCLLVEGEKAADAAQKHLPQYNVLTWPGGANAWKHADFTPLRGRRVDLWPDADEPGREAMQKIAALISGPNGIGCHGKMVDPRGLPEGGDAADLDVADILSWLRERTTVYAEQNPAPQAPQSPASPPPPRTVGEPAEAGPIPLEAYAGAEPPARTPEPPQQAQNDDDDGPDAVPMSEDFMADRFAAEHKGKWCYVKPWHTWFEWRGDGWYKDEKSKVDHLAVQITRQAVLWPEAQALTPEAKRRTNSKRTAGSVRDIAASDPRLAAAVDQWDKDTWLLGVPGGVVNLRDGTMGDGQPHYYMTKRCACAPEAGKPARWLDFLARVTGDDQELIAYLQRFAGYSLTGETTEHALVFFYGTGANGKSTFLQTISKVFGDYALSAGFELLAESKGDRHPTEIARLRGSRLVITEETDAGGRWNEGRIKRLTGGGKVSAHFMRQDDFEFEPHFKLMIAGNHKPMIRSVDEAMKRRIHVVPFTVTIPPEQRDKALLAKLEEEWPQILAWCIDGCRAWQDDSLNPPSRVLEATNEYVEAEDILGAWLDECCERSGVSDGKTLYSNWCTWCEAQGEKAWSRRSWSSAMLDRGFQQKRSADARSFMGVSLKLGANLPEPRY